MPNPKQLLLEASESIEKFLDIIKKHHNAKDDFILEEVIPTLNKEELDSLWINLGNEFTGTILSFGSDNERYENDCEVIQGIVTVAMETIKQNDLYLPESLINFARTLYNMFLSFPDELDKIKNNISHLFEFWWKEQLPCSHELALHSFIYLLERTQGPRAVKSDVKRVYQMCQVMDHLDLTSESNAVLRTHLQNACVSLLYLNCSEGRKFISHAFNQSPALTDILHKTVKNHLPWAPKSVMHYYGEIYLCAWRNAMGQNLVKLELSCIQDFMYHSILAKPELASLIRMLLSYIHQHKAHRGVDQMLAALYEPILWRHLKVANGSVRLQAVLILIDAFPIFNPSCKAEERDEVLQKQFDTLREMLYDPSPSVRAAVVSGVCSICEKYWEMIPPEVIKDLLHCIVNDLAHDSTSADVRAAVFRGLSKLIDTPLAHPTLKSVLPGMSLCLHDKSEKVRTAFVDMLLCMKGMKTIKFWEIVSLDHILARLEIDTAPVARRLVKLLIDSQLTNDKTASVHLARCITLIEKNHAAARRFYQLVRAHTTLGTVGRLMASIFVLLLSGLNKLDTDEDAENDFLESFGEVDRSPYDSASPISEEKFDLLKNQNIVLGLLEIAVILWTSLSKELAAPSSQSLRQKLEKQASAVLPGLFKHFKDPEIVTALTKLSGFIHPSLLPSVSKSVLARLKQITEDTPEDEYAPLVEVLCQWNQADTILVIISDWLMAGLDVSQTPRSKSRRSSRSTESLHRDIYHPQLALKLLTYLMRHKQCCQILLGSSCKKTLIELTESISVVKDCVEKRLRTSSSLGEMCSDDFLIGAFDTYLKLEILLHDKETNSAVAVIEQILSWANVELLALLKTRKKTRRAKKLLTQNEMTLSSDVTPDGATFSMEEFSLTTLTMTLDETMSNTILAQKRSVRDEERGTPKSFARDLIQRLLLITSDMMLVGIGTTRFASRLAECSVSLLKIDDYCSLEFLPLVCQLMYHIMSWTMNADLTPDDEAPRSQDEIIFQMLENIIEVIISMTTNKKQQAERVLSAIKYTMSQVLSLYYLHYSLNDTQHRNIMATIAVSIVTNMSITVEEDFNYEPRGSVDELPMLTAFFLSTLAKAPVLTAFFLGELRRCIQSGSVTKMVALAGICHVIYTLTKSKCNLTELKNVVSALEDVLRDQPQLTEQAEVEEPPTGHLFDSCKNLLEKCKQMIGMI